MSLETKKSKLALFGGPKTVTSEYADIFKWPIITDEHRKAVLDVLNDGNMSGGDVNEKFEKAYAADIGMKYALACNNGTAAIHAGLYGIGVGVGDEVIAPSYTYWASVVPLYSLGATPIFADVDPQTLCISPDDIERKISKRTKAIIVVHFAGMVADMDRIMAIADKHGLKVLEDGSHAHACTYKGKEVGTFGHVSAFSLMSQKSFGVGEGGMMFTNDRDVYEKAIMLGHYCKHQFVKSEKWQKYLGPCSGGYKYRMHQLSSAFGLVQLKYYRQQFAEIDKAMNYFCDQLEKVPGLRPMRLNKAEGNSKGGWYFPVTLYDSGAFDGLSNSRFVEALNAEGIFCGAGCFAPLYTHPLFTEMDIYGHGKPTRFANLPDNIDKERFLAKLPVTDQANSRTIALPWFKKYDKAVIDEFAQVFFKVAANYRDLLESDDKKAVAGRYALSKKKLNSSGQDDAKYG